MDLKKQYHWPGRVLGGFLAAAFVWLVFSRYQNGEFSGILVAAGLAVVFASFAIGGRRGLGRVAPEMNKETPRIDSWLLLLAGLGLIVVSILIGWANNQT